eukprot:TRINITY_DN9405_c0_g7_i1.p1 TRINITY_DN9405_c0_g7~~TRINITY_DN9405_c0_g7_i1.p1  ORF type:complete len:266 (-),score=48.38 TRINITY_DN9405_c0_g7_i1:97-894(-)
MLIKNSELVLATNLVTVKEIVQESFELVNELAKSKGLALSVSSEGEIPEAITTDKQRLKLILTELLECTVRLVHRGNVTLIVKPKEVRGITLLKWKITGTGLDLSNAVVTNLLDSSAQHSEVSLLDKRSPCINLFVSKKLIEAFNGFFKVKAKSRKGSYICFSTPVKCCREENSSAMSDSILPEVAEEFKCECPKLLVIEPNPINRYVINSYVERLKLQCTFAQDTNSALSLIEKRFKQSCCQYFSLFLVNLEREEQVKVCLRVM